MKILVILPRIPWPLEKGDKLRAYHQIRCLSKNNDIALFALNDNPTVDKKAAEQQLSKYCSEIQFFELKKAGIVWNFLKSFFSGKPLQVGYFYSSKAKKALLDFAEKTQPDHVFCQLIRTAEYGRALHYPKTIDYQDTFSQGMLRRAEKAFFLLKPAFKTEFRRLQRYEYNVFDWFDHKIIISKPDRDLLTHPKKEEVTVVPNGVDHQFFHPMDAIKKYDLIFNGNMSYPPNINAAELLAKKILPIVHQTLPNTTLLLSGATPHLKVRSLKSDKVDVSGWVDDIRGNYAACRIFIAPMQIGTGLQNKLLEAMCMKMPCITSALANASLGAKADEEILIGDTPESYAQHIVELLQNPEKAQTLAENGSRFVRTTFDWEHLTAILERLIVLKP